MKIKKALKYGFITCALAYLLGAVLIVIIFANVYKGTYGLVFNGVAILHTFTLMLSEFSWWGDFYYLAFLVPLLSSCCVLMLLVYGYGRIARRRALLTGFSIFIYYFAMCLVFLIYGLIYGWGDIAYNLIWLWPICGFSIGYAAATIVEKVSKFQVAD